jgi:hypothetical protein
MDIQTLYTIEIGEEFNFFFFDKNNNPLQIGSVVEIHDFQKHFYGKAKVIEVLGTNNYKAVRIQ